MAKDPEIFAHQEWLGYVQPVGLVVSIPALLSARAYINRNFAPDHRRFLEVLPTDKEGEPIPEIRDFPDFAKTFFGWTGNDLYGSPGAPALPASLEVALPEYNETLRPTYALRDFEPADPAREFLMLIQEFPLGTDLDSPVTTDAHHWQASPQAKFERLLRQTAIPIGLLVNGRQIRLVYAPEKELSGHITFNLGDMVTVAGRPIWGRPAGTSHLLRRNSRADRARRPRFEVRHAGKEARSRPCRPESCMSVRRPSSRTIGRSQP